MDRRRSKGRSDYPGGFAGIPRMVMKHPDYQNLSGGAVKLLVELAGQYRRGNNGDLTAAYSVLRKRGFGSKGAISRAVQELQKAGMIIQTRAGRFINPGGHCALYALTWQPIDECPGKGLEVEPTTTPPRKFTLENKKPGPQRGLGSVHKPGRPRPRDEEGRFSSVHKPGRLRVVP